jgi:hypothetical protein
MPPSADGRGDSGIFSCEARHHDSGIFSCEARHHAERPSTGQHLELLLLITGRGRLAGNFDQAAPRAAASDHGTRQSCRCPPNGRDDSGIFSCEARHHAEWASTGQHLELFLLITGRARFAGAPCEARHYAEWASTGPHPELLLLITARGSLADTCPFTAATTAASSPARLGITPRGLQSGSLELLAS